jgi:SAM-dependent methyltransferase
MTLPYHKLRDKDTFYRHDTSLMKIVIPIRDKLGYVDDTHNKILDLGCRDGELVKRLQALGYDAKGIDIRDDYIQDSPDWFIHADAANIPLDDDSIDLITSRLFFDDLMGLQHLTEQQVYDIHVKECHRILRPGGLIVSHFDQLPLRGGQYFQHVHYQHVSTYQVNKH